MYHRYHQTFLLLIFLVQITALTSFTPTSAHFFYTHYYPTQKPPTTLKAKPPRIPITTSTFQPNLKILHPLKSNSASRPMIGSVVGNEFKIKLRESNRLLRVHDDFIATNSNTNTNTKRSGGSSRGGSNLQPISTSAPTSTSPSSSSVIAQRHGGFNNSPITRGDPSPQGTRSSLNPSLKMSMSNIKILSGSRRSQRILSPSVHLRPMMSKVKAGLFSSLTDLGLFSSSQLKTNKKLKFADVFAGSGSIGLEGLSRVYEGGAHCMFVDLSPVCTKCIEDNCNKLKFEKSVYNVETMSASEYLLRDLPNDATGENELDLIILTPPYIEISFNDLIRDVLKSKLTGIDCIVVIEYPLELGVLSPVFSITDNGDLIQSLNPHQQLLDGEVRVDKYMVGLRNRRYGRTVLATYVVNPSGMKDEKWESRVDEFLYLK